MPRRVGEGFLADAEKRCSQLRFHRNIVRTGDTGAGNTGALLKILALPLEGRDDSQVVQDGRTQFGGQSLHGSNGCIDLFLSSAFLGIVFSVSIAIHRRERSILRHVSPTPNSSCNSRAIRARSASCTLASLPLNMRTCPSVARQRSSASLRSVKCSTVPSYPISIPA